MTASDRSIWGMVTATLVGFADDDSGFLVTLRGPRRADTGTDCREAVAGGAPSAPSPAKGG